MADDDDFFDEITTQSHEPAVEEQVQVRFVTKITDPSLRIPDSNPIAVPVSFARYALSELVNHILGLEVPRMFDFLIEDKLMRETLAEYLKKKNQSIQDIVLELEYVEIIPKPDPQRFIQQDDWVSCLFANVQVEQEPTFVDGVRKRNWESSFFFSGSYDQRVRLWNASGHCLFSFNPHSSPITTIASTKRQPWKKTLTLITAAQDATIKTWEVDANNGSYKPESEQTYLGHTDIVTSVAIDPSVTTSSSRLRFCSSSWDKTVLIWQPYHDYIEGEVKESQLDDELNEDERLAAIDIIGVPEEDNAKRRRIVTRENTEPKQQLKGHTQVVNKVEWMNNSYNIASGSADHSIRIWDVPSGVSTSVLNGNEVVNSLSFSPHNGLIASAHPDRLVRLWDHRSQGREIIKKKMRSHTKWVSDVCWHPQSPNLLISSSHDNTIKLWDIRSDFALHTLTSHSDKVLCLAWNGPSSFLSGSADSRVFVHSLPALPNEQLK